MKELTRNEQVLIDLLKHVLFQVPLEIEGDVNWDEVLQEAEKQTVSGLVASVAPVEAGEAWHRVFYRVIAKNVQICHAQRELIDLFSRHSIPLVILKGTAAAIYYPNPLLRIMGDIDFIIPKDAFETAVSLMKKNGYTISHQEVEKDARHIGYEKNGIIFELHHHFSYPDLDIEAHIIEGLDHAEIATVSDTSFPMLPRLSNGMVLLAHMREHLQSGMGLRQAIDWMMYVNKELNDDFWNAEFRQAAEMVGLEELAITTTRMGQLYFGLDNNLSWCKSADERLCGTLLENLLLCGNFGNKLNSGKQVETVATAFRKMGVFRYLQKAGEHNWKAYKKYRWLRPFCWFYQIFRYIRQGVRAKRGKDIFQDLDQSKERYEMLKKLGVL